VNDALSVCSAPGRLAVVLSHPTQYYSPWFRWLRTHTALEFRVFYLWNFGVTAQTDPQFGKSFAWDVDLLAGYASEFVPNQARDPGTHHFGGLRNPTLPARLAAYAPTALLFFGYNWASHLRALVWARRRGLPLIFRGDSHLLHQPSPPWHKRLLLRLLYRQFTAITYVGAANRSYFRTLGVPEAKLVFAPHAVNHDHFVATPDRRRAADELRATLGLGGRRVAVFAGKLVPAKQPLELLQAFIAISNANAALVFVGDGVERPALEALAARHPEACVRFLPFANQSEMPVRYLLADVFVLPSRGHYETWGLAVNEAMHMGVPCLVSDHVGCQEDLVTDGETGWVFPADDHALLAVKLHEALTLPAGAALGQRVAARIAGYTYAQTAAGLLQAVALASR
jgi:glycosyltransferase involved in cell wall biosynthesis